MMTRTVTLPELGLFAGTRVALGAGLGLLLGDRLQAAQRRAVGWTLFAVGAITTIPLVASIVSRGRHGEAGHLADASQHGRGTTEAAAESH